MKKTLFILLLFLSQICSAQQTTVMFLDIPTVNGEYVIPTRTTVTPLPTKTNNLLIKNYSFDWTKDSRIRRNSGNSTIENGEINEIGEMTLSFQIDKSVMALFDRLVNNTLIEFIDLFIDKPANNNPTPQTEIKRIRMEGVIISELSLISDEIPQYRMKLQFIKVSTIDHNVNGIGIVSKGTPYGRDFLTKTAYTYPF